MERESQLGSKLAWLELAVSDGVDRVTNKCSIFDNVDAKDKRKSPDNEAVYGPNRHLISEDAIGIILSKISHKDISEMSSDEKTLVATGYEFVWGQKTPEEISKHKEAIICKSNYQDMLNALEKRLVKVSHLDTDYF